jgi:RNA polymerase sigma-70 factor, ECF subfamily
VKLDFPSLYAENNKLVRSVIFQIAGAEALDDLVQEAFVRIWKGLPDFNEQSKLSSWIYRISVNTALDYIRGKSRMKETSNEDLLKATASRLDHDYELASRDLVLKGLLSLSVEHRAVLVLAYIHDLALREVAEILGISEGTVKSRLHYAKAEFKKFISANGVENDAFFR